MPKLLRKSKSAPRPAQPASDPRVIAVLHFVKNECHGLIARRNGHTVDITATKTFAADDATVKTWLQERLAARCVVVLPSASVIVRAVQLPKTTEDKLQSALELNATTFVLGRTPDYRVASALLPGERGEDALRTGIVAEWPIDQPAPPLVEGVKTFERISYAPEVAALAALAASCGQPLVAIDPEHGAVAVAAPTSRGLMVRIVRASDEGGGIDAQEVGRAIGEACVHSSVPAAELAIVMERTIQSARSCLSGGFGAPPDSLASLESNFKMSGVAPDAEWWRTYGVQAGAAAAACGSCIALTQLQANDPGARADRAGVILNKVAQPKTAGRLLVAALLAIALGPLALQGLRLLVLQWKLPDRTAYERAETADTQKRALYRMLSRNASSMTKTLSDIGAAAPQGIELDFINIAQGVTGQAVTLRGRALPYADHSATELIHEMEQLMRKSQMFMEITRSSEPPHQGQGGAQEFTVNAIAVRPTEIAAYPPEQDYALKSMRVRLHGEMPPDVDLTGETADLTPPSPPSNPPRTASSESGASENGEASEGSGGRTRGGTTRTGTSRNGAAPTVGTGEGERPTTPATTPAAEGSAAGKPEAGKTDAGATPAGATPAGTTPAGTTPAGTTPAGAAPAGTTPAGTEPAAAGAAEEGGAGRAARTPRTGSGGLATRGGGALGGSSNAPEPPPPPLTEAEINAMTKAEAQSMLAVVAKARQRADLAEDVIARLKTEFDLLLERCRRD